MPMYTLITKLAYQENDLLQECAIKTKYFYMLRAHENQSNRNLFSFKILENGI